MLSLANWVSDLPDVQFANRETLSRGTIFTENHHFFSKKKDEVPLGYIGRVINPAELEFKKLVFSKF